VMRLLWVCVLATAAACAQSQLDDLFQGLVERVHPAVVQVIARGISETEQGGAVQDRKGAGAGVIVDPAGFIVTNAHVVSGSRRVQVVLPVLAEAGAARKSVLKPFGKTVPADVVGMDRETDIAVLKVAQTGLPALKFGDSDSLKQGKVVFAFGSPFGLDNSVTMGVISSVARQVRPDDAMIYIQTDASINPGNSGGPLVGVDGALVGINTFIVSRSGGNEGIGFAAPSNIVKNVYDQIRKHGRVRRGQIGVIAQTISPALARALSLEQDWGVLIADVAPKSAAEAAGLEVRDVVVALNGKPMENARQFGVNIYQHAGNVIALDVLRGDRKIAKKVAVLERPQDPDRILSLIEGDANTVPRLGFYGVDLDGRVAPLLPPLRKLAGVVVAGTTAELAASQDGGLHAGDVIYALNSTSVRSLADLRGAVQNLPRGEIVALQIERLGQLQFVLLEIE
jgi:serine protease Do